MAPGRTTPETVLGELDGRTMWWTSPTTGAITSTRRARRARFRGGRYRLARLRRATGSGGDAGDKSSQTDDRPRETNHPDDEIVDSRNKIERRVDMEGHRSGQRRDQRRSSGTRACTGAAWVRPGNRDLARPRFTSDGREPGSTARTSRDPDPGLQRLGLARPVASRLDAVLAAPGSAADVLIVDDGSTIEPDDLALPERSALRSSGWTCCASGVTWATSGPSPSGWPTSKIASSRGDRRRDGR